MLYATVRGGALTVYDASFRPIRPSQKKTDLCFVSRSDLLVSRVELPNVPKRDRRSALEYRIDGLFPGGAAHTVFDHFAASGNDEGAVIVVSAAKEVLDTYRLGLPRCRLVLPEQILLAADAAPKDGVVLFVTPTEVEFIRFESGSFLASGFVERTRTLTDDLENAILEVGLNTDDTVNVYVDTQNAGEATDLVHRLDTKYTVVDPATVTRSGTKRSSLFPPAKATSSRTRAFVVLAAALVATSGIGYRGYAAFQQRRARLAALQAQVRVVRDASLAEIAASDEISRIEERLTQLGTNNAVDVYRVLSEFVRHLDSEDVVRSFVVRQRDVEASIEGRDPYVVASRLTASTLFDGVRVSQVIVDAESGSSRFTVFAEYIR